MESMIKNFKSTVYSFLVLMLLFPQIPGFAWAEDWDKIKGTTVQWEPKKKVKIGVVDLISSTEVSAYFNTTYRKECEKRGWDIQITDLQMNTAKAPEVMENYIAGGVSGILIAWTPPRLVEKQIKAAYENNIAVISVSGGELQPFQTAEFSTSDVSDGALQAQYITNAMPSGGKVIIVYIATTQNNVQKYTGGKSYFDVQGVKIAYEHSITSGDPENETYKTVKNVLLGDKNKEIKGVWTAFDGLGLGAAKAINELGRSDVIVASLDDGPRALEALKTDPAFNATTTFIAGLLPAVIDKGFSTFEDAFEGKPFKIGYTDIIQRMLITKENCPPAGYFLDPCGYDDEPDFLVE